MTRNSDIDRELSLRVTANHFTGEKMERFALGVGIGLLGCALVAAVMYALAGQWLPVLLLVTAPPLAKLALGLLEIMLTPVFLAMTYCAERRLRISSGLLAASGSLLTNSVFSAYCAAVLVYFVAVPGPPAWLAIAPAIVVASAPFHWAAGRARDDHAPCHFDLIASMAGTALAGSLLVLGVPQRVALLPVALLFLLSAIHSVVWWTRIGAMRARNQHLLFGGM